MADIIIHKICMTKDIGIEANVNGSLVFYTKAVFVAIDEHGNKKEIKK